MMPGMMAGGGYPGQPSLPGPGTNGPGPGGMGMMGGYGGQAGRDESRVAGRMDTVNAPQSQVAGGVVGRQGLASYGLSNEGQVAGVQAGQAPAVDFQQMVPQRDAYAAETHLASLDVELPLRGREYLFTTPRGDIEITARAVSEPLLGRLIRLLLIGAGFIVLLVLLRVLPRVLPVLHGSRWFAAAVLLIGLVSLLLGIFPILALVALIYGLVQLIRLEIARRRRAAAPAPAA